MPFSAVYVDKTQPTEPWWPQVTTSQPLVAPKVPISSMSIELSPGCHGSCTLCCPLFLKSRTDGA